MRNKKSFYARWSWLILASTLVVVPYAFINAGNAVQSNVNKVEDWLPTSFRETSELKYFRDNFPTDQFVLLTWEGCKIAGDPEVFPDDVDDPRIDELAKALRGEGDNNDPDVVECRKYVKSVTTGRDILNQLVSPPQNLPHAQAVERLKGSVIGQDGRQTCLLISLTDQATSKLKAVVGRGQYRVFRPSVPPGVIRRLMEKAGVPDKIAHLGGPPIDNVSIDEEGEKTLIRLAGLSGLLGLGLAWWSLRSVWLTFVVFSCGVLSAAFSLAAIWVTGETVDAIVLSMPSLVYVLAISGAVHLINYYRDAIREKGFEGATERGVLHALRPAVLCTATTALGLLSLYASELTPIRKFGLYSALGVGLTLIVLFLFLPAALHVSRFGKRWVNEKREEDDELDAAALLDTANMNRLGRMWNSLGTFIIGHHGLVATACFALIAVVGGGLYYAKTSIDLLELFDSQARILQDYRWIEKRLGMLVPLEIVIKFSPDSQAKDVRTKDSTAEDLFRLTMLERLETTKLIQETIEKEFGEAGQKIVGRSISAATFAPSMPSTTGGLATFSSRLAYNKRFEQSKEEFIKSGYLRMDSEGNELWRISLRVAAFQGVDYGMFVHELRESIHPLLKAHEFRVEILTQLTADRDNGSFAGSKVFLWDSPTPDGYESGTLPPNEMASWKNHEMMVDALASLLATAQLKVTRGQADPDKVPFTKMQQLNQLDRVALVGRFTDDQVDAIGFALPKAIDLHGVVGPEPKGTLADLASENGDEQPWLSAVYTGVVPIVYKAQRTLLQSLVQSTLWSFMTITPLMMFVSRSVRAGMVAMLPNILPVVFIFGAMGWMGIAVDIGSMMTASIALGVAVDDTIHYLSWFRDDLEKLKDRHKSILVAYQRCATPTLQAALISGLGLSVFAFSTFTPTQRFGWLMLTILIAGVVAELIMLPAILAGPLGKVFDRTSRRHRLNRWWLIARYQARRLSENRIASSGIRRAA